MRQHSIALLRAALQHPCISHTCSVSVPGRFLSTQAGREEYHAKWQRIAWSLAAVTGVSLGAGCLSAGAESSNREAVFTKGDVSKHQTPEQRVWVTYKDGVYDITDFVEMHPGGSSFIMMAAGGAVDPFWQMYQQHLKDEVRTLLQPYRIGRLADYKGPEKKDPAEDPWKDEPSRHPALMPRSNNPCNAETPGSIVAANLITSNDIFYVRNHLPVPPEPEDPAKWQLSIGGEEARSVSLTLEDLKTKFKKTTISATVECAGNRRNEMKAVKPVRGLDWDTGAIGNANWGGVKLRDVLLHAGVDPDVCDSMDGPKHVHFLGADSDPLTGDVYAASIPIELAMASNKDVLLAYEMNGEPLSRDHGAPLRVVVPGVVGARSVKWVTQIITSREESDSHWQQHDYKSFSPSVDWDTVDWSSAPAIQEAPVTSAITEPSANTQVEQGTTTIPVRGYAWSGGGRDVVRVDVSADGGATWQETQLHKVPGQKPGRAWAWTLWEAEVTLPTPPANSKGPHQVCLICKATDASYNTQPDSVAGVWNLRGVVNNAWHRVGISVGH